MKAVNFRSSSSCSYVSLDSFRANLLLIFMFFIGCCSFPFYSCFVVQSVNFLLLCVIAIGSINAPRKKKKTLVDSVGSVKDFEAFHPSGSNTSASMF
jgi:hypothetical protein